MPFSAAEKRRRREAERNAALRGNPDALEKRAREIQTMKLTSKVILTQIGILIQKAILTRGGN